MRIAMIILLCFGIAGCGRDVLKPLAREHCDDAPPAEANVGNVINSHTDDYAPRFIGDRLIYSSGVTIPGKHPKALQSELLVSHRSSSLSPDNLNKGWDQPQYRGAPPLQGISFDLNEGAFDYLPDSHYAVFAAERLMADSGQSALLDLYEVQLDDDLHATSTPKPLADVNDPDAWDSQPALTKDGKTLFFVSDRNVSGSGPRQSRHIWVSNRISSGWSKPTVLPKPFSTDSNDVSPYVGADGNFYFSSNGNPDGQPPPPGMGQLDIFYVRLDGNQFKGHPVRLPQPFNSPSNDDFPFLTRDSLTFFWSSDRPGGCGQRDIYASRTPQVVILRGVIRRTESNDSGWTPPMATTAVVSIAKLAGNGNIEQSVSILTGQDGGYAVKLSPNQRYAVMVDNKDCYLVDGPYTVSTASLGAWDTTYIDQDFLIKYEPFRVELNNAVVPFFITGYWRMNTTAGYAQFQPRYSPNGDLPHVTSINAKDFRYDQAAVTVDSILTQTVYRPVLERLLLQLTRSCYDSSYYLDISVTGFTDRQPITDGDSNLYRDVETVRDGDSIIRSGNRLNGAESGNVKLSMLRAHFAEVEIENALMKDGDFAKYFRAGRIVFSAHGAGISEKYPDLAHNRRINIKAAIVKRR